MMRWDDRGSGAGKEGRAEKLGVCPGLAEAGFVECWKALGVRVVKGDVRFELGYRGRASLRFWVELGFRFLLGSRC